MDVRLPDGTIIRGVPDNITKADLVAKLQRNGYDVSGLQDRPPVDESVTDANDARIKNYQPQSDKTISALREFSNKARMFGPLGMPVALATNPDFLRGGKDVVDTGAYGLAKLSDKIGLTDSAATQVAQANFEGKTAYSNDPSTQGLDSKLLRLVGNAGATYPLGGIAGKALGAIPGLGRLGAAVSSGGMSTGAAPTGLAAKAADMGIRTAGGAISGGIQAGAVDPESAGFGAAVGGALPGAVRVLGATGKAIGGLVTPYFKSGQEQIAGRAINEFADNPLAALNLLKSASEKVPGSLPTAAQASNDIGLAGLTRTLQSADPAFSNNLANRLSAQNTARYNVLSDMAGADGQLDFLKAARAATGDDLYKAAFKSGIDPNDVTRGVKGEITKQLKNPYIQDALPIAKKLAQADNIKFDSGSLQGLHYVKKALDDKIESAASTGIGKIQQRQLIDAKDRLLTLMDRLSPAYSEARREFAAASKPINQMESLQDLLKRMTTGSTDLAGNPILSAASGVRTLANQSDELAKTLTPQQMDELRALVTDAANASRAQTAGKAVGSNTAQNLAQLSVLRNVIGKRGAEAEPVQGLLGRAMNFAYRRPNEQVLGLLGDAMLDPKTAARLMQLSESNPGLLLPYVEQASRFAPLLTTDP